MALVLQRVKYKQLSLLEERESQAAFQLVTGDSASGAMDAKQLKRCLRALGFAVDAAEARALVYEFDYNDTQTIGLVDFQRICLFKSLERSEAQLLDQACATLQEESASDTIQRHQLHRTALSTAERHTTATERATGERDGSNWSRKKSIDAAAFVECIKLQRYDDAEAAAVDSFLA
ncbi:hypothetical protein FI667_g12938, partial [Globisporangium splendens]